MNCYFDTSALVKLYHEEDGTEVLVNFCDSHADDLIISIAEVTIVELRSAFWRHVRTGELKEQKVRALLSEMIIFMVFALLLSFLRALRDLRGKNSRCPRSRGASE